MNYQRLTKIEKILKFFVSCKELYYVKKSKELIFRNKIITNNTTENGYLLDCKYFFFSNELDLKTQVLNIETNEIVQIGFLSPFYASLFENKIICYKYQLPDYKRSVIRYDLKSNRLDKVFLNREDFSILYTNQQYLINSKNNNEIFFLSSQTGEIFWQYSVSEIGKYTDTDNYSKPYQHEGEVRKIIGVCGDILLVVISGGFEGKNNVSSQLIGLSCQSGELLWRLDMFDANGIRTTYGSYENLQIDEPNKRLLGFYSQGFIEIAIETGTVRRFKHLSYTTGEELLRFEYKGKILTNVYSETLVGDHLYFKATNIANRRHSLSSNVIGAYNHLTETIDWLHEFEDLAPSVSIQESPTVEGNRLYVLDSGGTLHIFEREEVEKF